MERYSTFGGKALLFLLFLWSIRFLNLLVRMVFSPILPIIQDEFAIDHAGASSIFMFMSAGFGVALICSGLFSGKLGHKKSIVFSLALTGLAAFLIPLVHNFFLLYPFAFLLGFSVGLYLPSAIPLITDYYSERDWGKAIAIQDTGAAVGILAAPFTALGLLCFFPWRGIFVVLGCAFLISSVAFYSVAGEVKTGNAPSAVFKDIVRKKSLWLMAVIWIFGMGANLGIYSIIPLYLTKELDVQLGSANTILGVSRLGSIGAAIACGFFIDRFRLREFMFFTMMMAGIFTLLTALAPAQYVGIALFLQALFVAGIPIAGFVAIAKTFNREMRGLATGIIVAASTVFGSGMTAYLLGVSGDLYSFRLGIAVLGIFLALAAMLVFRIRELEQP